MWLWPPVWPTYFPLGSNSQKDFRDTRIRVFPCSNSCDYIMTSVHACFALHSFASQYVTDPWRRFYAASDCSILAINKILVSELWSRENQNDFTWTSSQNFVLIPLCFNFTASRNVSYVTKEKPLWGLKTRPRLVSWKLGFLRFLGLYSLWQGEGNKTFCIENPKNVLAVCIQLFTIRPVSFCIRNQIMKLPDCSYKIR